MPINPSSASSATSRTGSGLAVELLGDRRDALLRELANRGADELVLLGQVESTRPGCYPTRFLGCGCGFSPPFTQPVLTLMRSATREPSVEALLLLLETLTRERQDLRQDLAAAPTLEQNRLAIVEAQWDLSAP